MTRESELGVPLRQPFLHFEYGTVRSANQVILYIPCPNMIRFSGLKRNNFIFSILPKIILMGSRDCTIFLQWT